MNECDEGKDKAPLPAQQTQQPQPVFETESEGLAARRGSLSGNLLDGSTAKERESEDDAHTPGVDEARFTAGIVRFYEAVLKEPIPEKMLRLIDEIAKQERKL